MADNGKLYFDLYSAYSSAYADKNAQIMALPEFELSFNNNFVAERWRLRKIKIMMEGGGSWLSMT